MPPGAPAVVVPDFVLRPVVGAYRSLNPLTKFVVALASALVAFGVRGWTGPIAVIGVTVLIAIVAAVSRRLSRFVLATVPLVASIILVNTFLYPGATDVIGRVGPFAATWTGLTIALQATLRVVAFALSVALFSLTTRTDDLLSDLEVRGLGRRATFVVGTAVATVPRMIERAADIVEAQRARGLDTEGSIRRRIRGILPLAGPMVLGAISEVEERAVALEARAFTAPGRKTIMRRLPDSGAQRAARWVLGIGSVVLVIASVTGHFPLP